MSESECDKDKVLENSLEVLQHSQFIFRFFQEDRHLLVSLLKLSHLIVTCPNNNW